jgi:mannose-6-phosphate isomerase-like protein (cupin superfamily)
VADAMQKKNLDASPDEEKTFDHGERRAVSLGEFKVARAVLQPGWKWSEHVKPIAQTDSCQVEHNSIKLSGRVKIVMEDGSEMEVGPGDVYVVPPGHDAWVVGDEPAVGIEVSIEAVEDWGKEAGS